jgi:hypothetical protein
MVEALAIRETLEIIEKIDLEQNFMIFLGFGKHVKSYQ